MKILHVIPSLGPLRGGPSFSLPVMACHLARAGLEVHIATTDDNGPARLSVPLNQPLIQDGVTTHYFPRQSHFYTVTWPLTRWLLRHIREYDIVHIHALFSYPSAVAAWAAARSGVPYVVRPLGTLERWGMTRRRPYLKRLSYPLIERRIVQGAAAVHYTSDRERQESEELGSYAPAAVIPLGIELDTPHVPFSPEAFLHAHPAAVGRTIVLFLGRLDRKKGLDLLLPAFARVHDAHPAAMLVLAGHGEEVLARELRQQVSRLGLSGDVLFTGFLDGAQKRAVLVAAHVFVLPSYSENFAVAAVEAMAAGIPVVLSDQVAIAPVVRASDAGVVVPAQVEALTEALDRLVSNGALRSRLGANARRVAQTRFGAQHAADELVVLYHRVSRREAIYAH